MNGAGRDRIARRLHAALLFLIATGVAVWLIRTYGFAPLSVRESIP